MLYLQFQKEQVDVQHHTDGLARFDLNDNVWVARLGLNYRWDNPRAAYAADYPVKAAAPIYGCGPQRFNGGYVGGNIGGVGYTADRNDLDGHLTDNGSYSATKAGFTAGAQIGWDWQNCHKVFGVVADWNWAGTKADSPDEPNDPADPNQGFKSKLSSFGTIRARAGLVADDSMIYVTAGLAGAKIKTTITEGSNVNPQVFNFDKTRWGLAAGVGAEFALWSGWSVNSELIYMQFSKQTVTGFEPDPVSFDLVEFRLGHPRRPQLSLGRHRQGPGGGEERRLSVRAAALQRLLWWRQCRRRRLYLRPQRPGRLRRRQHQP